LSKQYKRKFLVPGDTVKDCWAFRKQCRKEHPDLRPCQTKGRYSYASDPSKCPYPIGKPTEYIVAETEEGEWQCSCPHWKFRREECGHIRKAKANPEKYEISKEHTQRTTETLKKIFS